jgi:hypothetical protein
MEGYTVNTSKLITAKPFFDRMFGSWSLRSQKGGTGYNTFSVNTPFCLITSSWNFLDECIVSFSPRTLDDPMNSLSVKMMRTALGQRTYFQSQSEQFAWLEEHRALFKSWCEPRRFLRLDKLSSDLFDNWDELSLLLNSGPPEFVTMAATSVSIPPDFAVDAQSANLLERASPYLSLLFKESRPKIEIFAGKDGKRIEISDPSITLCIALENGSVAVRYLPTSALPTGQWLRIGEVVSYLLSDNHEVTLEDQLYIFCRYLSYFRSLCDPSSFQEDHLSFKRSEEIRKKLKRVALLQE